MDIAICSAESDSQGTLTEAMEFNNTIHCPMVTGSGAYIVHQLLAQNFGNYQLTDISPRETLLPPLLGKYARTGGITHTAPDLGPAVIPPESPAVVTFHNYYLDDEAMRAASFAQKLFYSTILKRAVTQSVARATVVTAVSDFTAGLVKNHLGYAGTVEVIKNGVDEARFCPTGEQHQGTDCRVLYSGNLTRRKGAHLIDYIAQGLPAGSHMAITSGLRTDQLGNADDQIQSLGRIPYEEIHKAYQSADVLIFPTLREGLGLAAVEAMACGLPVVSTRCSALPEVVDHGKGGYLCEPYDGPTLLKRVRELIENPAMRQEMGEYNREKVLREFRLQQMLDSYAELFSGLT